MQTESTHSVYRLMWQSLKLVLVEHSTLQMLFRKSFYA